jgi:hypothetical protein
VAFLIFLAGDFFENHRSMSARIASWGASIIGFFVMLPCMFVNQSKFYFFVKDKLGLPEYMINFIPDLSPILGAWKMFASRILYTVKGMDPIFMYNPDYRLISPISASMAGYNNFDSWVIKIINFSPEYSAFAVALAAVMAIISAATLTYILYECSRSDTEL